MTTTLAAPKSKAVKARVRRPQTTQNKPVTLKHRHVMANGLRFFVAESEPSAPTPSVPPILCLHGFPEGWMCWRPLMRLLPEAILYAPDLRGYPLSPCPNGNVDVFTLIEDVRALIEALGLERPILLCHDWGGAIGWIFAHRYSSLIDRLIVVNCTHPKTLVRAALHFDELQPLRIPWVLPFQVPYLPEALISSRIGRKLLKLSFTLRASPRGNMNEALVDEIVGRFKRPKDLRGAIDYYRDVFKTLVLPKERKQLESIYAQPISAPTTLVWGMLDEALPYRVAQQSYRDAGIDVEWRPLDGIGHFVDLEAPELLAKEVRRHFPNSSDRG